MLKQSLQSVSFLLQIRSKKEKQEEILLGDQLSCSSLCRTALFEQQWWLAAVCCNWGKHPDLRELTKAKLRRSTEKEDDVKEEFPDWS